LTQLLILKIREMEVKTIHWKDNPTKNKFLATPNVVMTTETGYHVPKKLGTRWGDRESYVIHYDRDYVIQFFANKLVGLTSMDNCDLVDLLNEAIQEAKNHD
jgi:hypothetical protein